MYDVDKFQSSKALWCFFRCISYIELSYFVVVRTLLLCLGNTWPPKFAIVIAILCYFFQSLQDTVTSLSTLIYPFILILMLCDTVIWSNKNILSEEKFKVRCGIRNHLSSPSISKTFDQITDVLTKRQTNIGTWRFSTAQIKGCYWIWLTLKLEIETEVEAIPWKYVEDMEVCSMHSRWRPELVCVECKEENPSHSCFHS